MTENGREKEYIFEYLVFLLGRGEKEMRW